MRRRRAEYRIIKGQRHKLCTGVGHREGHWVPTPDGWYFRVYKGRRIERSECRECMTYRHGSEPMVPYLRVRFAVTELVNRLGKAEASRRIGIPMQLLWKWQNGHYTLVQRKSAVKILFALRDVRAEELVRHRDSIHHGAKLRGRTEKVPRAIKDLYKPNGDAKVARGRYRRRADMTS